MRSVKLFTYLYVQKMHSTMNFEVGINFGIVKYSLWRAFKGKTSNVKATKQHEIQPHNVPQLNNGCAYSVVGRLAIVSVIGTQSHGILPFVVLLIWQALEKVKKVRRWLLTQHRRLVDAIQAQLRALVDVTASHCWPPPTTTNTPFARLLTSRTVEIWRTTVAVTPLPIGTLDSIMASVFGGILWWSRQPRFALPSLKCSVSVMYTDWLWICSAQWTGHRGLRPVSIWSTLLLLLLLHILSLRRPVDTYWTFALLLFATV